MDLYDGNTICVKIQDKIYKIFTITSHSDGGIDIHIPYCKEKKGYIIKLPVDYSKRYSESSDFSKEYIVDNDTKLSIHKSGFVQFSGKEITSGIDKVTNEIKGVGVHSAPMKNPINTGPTAMVTYWGALEGFTEKKEKQRKNRFYIIFEDNDFILEEINKKNETTAFSFDIFIFHPKTRLNIKNDEKGQYLTLPFYNYMHPGAIFTFPILQLKGLNNVIGILPFKRPSEFAQDFKYGYVLSGPAEKTIKNGRTVWEALMCTYPRVFGNRNLPSLNRHS
ncbi:MAG: hypothetical protein WA057_01125 [Candidatus Magasanikiibacteriota bacterium]